VSWMVILMHDITGEPIVEQDRRLARYGWEVISQQLSHDYIACHCLLPFPSQRHARWHIPAVKPDRPLAQEVWKTDGLVFPAGV
jgi:hypothetical protein